jgi:site-specific recombinase XerD
MPRIVERAANPPEDGGSMTNPDPPALPDGPHHLDDLEEIEEIEAIMTKGDLDDLDSAADLEREPPAALGPDDLDDGVHLDLSDDEVETAGVEVGRPRKHALSRADEIIAADHQASLHRSLEAARTRAREALEPSTIAKYQAAFDVFAEWCFQHDRTNLPASPETMAAYIGALADAGRAPTTMTVAIAAIRRIHAMAGHTPPDHKLIRDVIRGTVKQHRSRKAKPLLACSTIDHAGDTLPPTLLTVIDRIPPTLPGWRDKALILVSWAGALRRSETATLDWAMLEWVKEGLLLHLRHTKHRGEGDVDAVAIPYASRKEYCPLVALRTWRAYAGMHDDKKGPVFRAIRKNGKVNRTRGITNRTVARIIETRILAAGLDPSDYTSHSLRAGFLTTAARNHADLLAMSRHARHRSVQTTRGYVREQELFKGHAGKGLL